MREHINVELKARCKDPERVRALLAAAGARLEGVDDQRDTYFKVPHGRLKLRRGNIERALIHYERPDAADVKLSQVTLSRLEAVDERTLDEIEGALTRALGIRSVVGKRREIRFVDNVKFHLDEVPGLGAFVEIEAIEAPNAPDEKALHAQCEAWRVRLGIESADLVDVSYADLVSSSPRRHP
jgi:predicted adenylyl cyclase CyaB